MLSTYLPVISAVVVALITFAGNYYIGRLKNNIDVRSLATNAGDALRDDLLEAIDRADRREQMLSDRIDKAEKHNNELRELVATLQQEILSLRIENRKLKADLEATQAELAKFERKVYYKPQE